MYIYVCMYIYIYIYMCIYIYIYIYKQLGNDENLKLLVYADASHGNLPDGGSQLGYLIFLVVKIKKMFNSSLAGPKELNVLLVLWLQRH